MFFIIHTQICCLKAQTTCVCDLTSPSCDVNCCCDQDCNGNDTLTFSTCLDTGFTTDTLQCVYDQVVFVNNLPTTTQVRQNGVFCIQRDMFSDRNFYIEPACKATSTCFDQVPPQFTFQQALPTALVFESFYRSGDPIYVIYSSGETGFFNVPSSGVSNTCQYSPIEYLTSTDSSCSWSSTNTTAICTENPALQCVNFTTSFKIAPTPTAFQLALNSSTPFDYSGLITITMDATNNCLTSNDCPNLVSETLFTFTTNGTNGITSVVATQTQIANPQTTFVSQRYIVQFVANNETIVQRSGNPGYLVGRPLIAGKSNGTISNLVVNSNPNVGLTIMQPSTADSCTTMGDMPILFGKDVCVGCQLSYTASSNCSLLQEEIYMALDRSNFDTSALFIGSFGNSSATNLDASQWFELARPSQTFPTSPNATCANMILGAQYQFLFANSGEISNPQPQVIGASYTYDTARDLGLVCTTPSCLNPQSVEITVSVSFVDVSETAVSVLQAQPTIYAPLPEDFFFPFKSSSTVIVKSKLWVMFFSILSCAVLIVYNT